MLQQNYPEDFVIATGRQESVRTFVELSDKKLGWGGINWSEKGTGEIGKRDDNGSIVIRIDSRYYRPSEVDSFLGEASKAKINLGWEPKIILEVLVNEMIENDQIEASKESILIKQNYFKSFLTN